MYARWSAFRPARISITGRLTTSIPALASTVARHAIYPQDEVPSAFQAQGGEILNQLGLSGRYEGANHQGEIVALNTTRALAPGEVLDLTGAINTNAQFFK